MNFRPFPRTLAPRTMLLMLVASTALAACSTASKPPPQLPPEPGPATNSTDSGSSSGAQGAPGSQADFVAATRGQDVIYFDTDKYDLDDADTAALRAQAQWLMHYTAKKATIEGHCDERGTREYNLALGERRANAAKSYLVSQGVDASRLTTVSYGKERPAALGSDEASWAKNRRAVTVTID